MRISTAITEGEVFRVDTRILRCGDIILTKNTSRISPFISYFTKGFSHAMVYLGNGLAAESSTSGVFRVNLSEICFKSSTDVACFRIDRSISENCIENLIDYVDENLCTQYTKWQAANSIRKRKPKQSNDLMFCSRFVVKAFEAMDIVIGNGDFTNPEEIIDKRFNQVLNITYPDKERAETFKDIEEIYTEINLRMLGDFRRLSLKFKTPQTINDAIKITKSCSRIDKDASKILDKIPGSAFIRDLDTGYYFGHLCELEEGIYKDVLIDNNIMSFERYIHSIHKNSNMVARPLSQEESRFENLYTWLTILKFKASLIRHYDFVAYKNQFVSNNTKMTLNEFLPGRIENAYHIASSALGQEINSIEGIIRAAISNPKHDMALLACLTSKTGMGEPYDYISGPGKIPAQEFLQQINNKEHKLSDLSGDIVMLRSIGLNYGCTTSKFLHNIAIAISLNYARLRMYALDAGLNLSNENILSMEMYTIDDIYWNGMHT